MLYYNEPQDEVSLEGYLAYCSFSKVVALPGNNRTCDGSSEFNHLLMNIRDGCCTQDDWKMLLSRDPMVLDLHDTVKENFMKLAFTNLSSRTQ